MGTGGTSEDSGQPETDNVIRFPRDWFGSKDDLIPIGPVADRLAETADAGEREDALSAGDFWGASAEELHQPVDLPYEGRAESSDAASQPGAAVRALHIVRPSPPRLARPHVSRVRLPGFRVPRAPLVLVAMLVAALALFASGVFRASRDQPQPVRSSALSAETARVAGPASPARRAGPARFGERAQAQLVSDSQLALRSAVAPYLVTATPARSARRAARRSARMKPAAHPVTPTRTTEASQPVMPELATVTRSTVAPLRPSTPVSRTPVQSQKPSTPTSGSSASSSGPTGLGGVVGGQCNPQCSG